jgi:hypothetical protein
MRKNVQLESLFIILYLIFILANRATVHAVTCYICGSDFQIQARHVAYQCRVICLCRLCALKSVTHIIFRCTCGRCDFVAKFPHRLRILAERLQLTPAARDLMAESVALVESSSCTACKAAT